MDGRTLRVLMIAPTSFFADYGCHVRILEEARALQRLGHRVTIVTYRNGRDLPDLDIRRTLPIPWRRHYEVGSSRHKIAFDALLGAKTLQILLRERFDVIHAHLHEGALIGLVLGRMAGLPVVFDFQGSLTEEMIDHRFLRRDGLFYRPLRKLETWIDHSVPLILTSSTNAERILIEEFGCDPARIRPLPDCVDTMTFAPPTEAERAQRGAQRQRLGLPADAPVIVYLGLLAPYQGTDLLLQAMQQLCRRRPDIYLLLMGFPGLEMYRGMAEQLGVADRVIFTGRIPYEQAPTYLKLGDVAVAPKLSLTEGAGKLLNYMALGLPTVAFDTPVAREYLGAWGVYAERGSAESLADKLASLLEDGEMRRHLGKQLRQRAAEQYDWNHAAHQVVDVYMQALGGYRRSTTSPPQIQSVDQS
ncbi:MAG: glycosyltransferase family 4 protein [Caldilinea sp.]|nr:glycosyltransferase family 4 protein [Caldilinea sp.]MDW8440102.1 glycosyltransferase family 4 protein [Caldilineaceae bacterium]